ncbi:hypothetical protein KQI82_14020 [Oscillibacter sp. MSJ-2]|uniref:Uncharacterized protein n=1 Tax=Dysosmobacter acutus TaxID=2841504 RepID=A0ABS6FD89_9FIRM|nr:hypothetical protein [Dysosmobacter acutus]MBU5628025.1 hypothetical protein [Dysosmobacter acutus]
MEIATRMMWVVLVFLLVFGAGVILLQVFLSRRESRWPGLILPGISFLWSLVYLLNLMPGESPLQTALMALFTALLSNIPTFVLLAVYFACRERRRKKDAVEKMNIQDL